MPKSPIEFVRLLASNIYQRAGNRVQLEDTSGVAVDITDGHLAVSSKALAKTPDLFVYEYLVRTSGPASGSGTLYDMDTNSSLVAPSVFEYQVPAGEVLELSRVNVEMMDGGMRNDRFAGIAAAALANGCLFQVIDTNGTTELLDFLNGIPIVRNADFAPLSGVDSIIQPAAGDDLLPIRFSIFKAGSEMLLTAGQRIRWTNRDNLSTISIFRMAVQATLQSS